MGNRCVITWAKSEHVQGSHELGIYLHYNGGIDTVKALLKFCELKGYASPDKDDYGYARLCQVIGNYIGGVGSVGINQCQYLDCDNWDNGTYICSGWNIEKQEFRHGVQQTGRDMEEVLLEINEKQPAIERLPEGLIRSAVLGGVPTADLKIGEKVYVQDFRGKWEVFKIIGFGEDEWVNGHNVKGIPYFDKYRQGKENINNYVLDDYAYSAEQ